MIIPQLARVQTFTLPKEQGPALNNRHITPKQELLETPRRIG